MRRVRSQKSLSVNEALNKIRNTSNHLKALGTLTKVPRSKYEAALNILRHEQDSKRRNYCKLFLQDLLSSADETGPTLVMLCAVALGQTEIAKMNRSTRLNLSRQLKGIIQELDNPVLRKLTAAVPKPPEYVPGYRARSLNDGIPQFLPTADANETDATRPLSLDNQSLQRLQLTEQRSSLKLNQLDADTIEFLGIISSIGDCFPRYLFDLAHNSLTWGHNGEAVCPGVGVPKGYDKMLDRLRKGGFTVPLPENGTDTMMMIHPDVPGILSCFDQVAAERWKRLATNTILHAYPKDAQLRPIEYAEHKHSTVYN